MKLHLRLLAAGMICSCFSFAQVFTVYNTSNSGISSNNCISLGFSQGDVWTASTSPGNGLSTFNGSAWSTFTTTNSILPSNETYDVSFDSQNNVWAATSLGLAKYNGSSWTIYSTSNSSIPNDALTTVEVGAGDTVWIGSTIGLIRFDGTNFSLYSTSNSGIADNYISDISSDNAGKIWLSHYTHGISVFNHASWTIYDSTNSPLTVNDIRKVDFDSNNNAWIATYGDGLAMFDGLNWSFYTPLNSSIMSDELTSVYVDANDRIYAGCGGGSPGLSVYAGVTWTNFSYTNSNLPYGGVMGIVAGSGNDRWIATFGGGLAKFDVTVLGVDEKFFSPDLLNLYPNPAVQNLCIDLRDLKVGNKAELIVYDANGKKQLGYVVMQHDNIINLDIAELSKGFYVIELKDSEKLYRGKLIKSDL